jgi:hypothetical protein
LNRLLRWSVLIGAIALVTGALPAHAGVNVWQKDDSYIDVGMLIQTQGRALDGGGAGTDSNTDSIFFRRLRPFERISWADQGRRRLFSFGESRRRPCSFRPS